MSSLIYDKYEEIGFQRTESSNYKITAACLYELQGVRMMGFPFIIVTLCLAFSGCHSDVQAFCNQGGHFGIQRRFAFVTN